MEARRECRICKQTRAIDDFREAPLKRAGKVTIYRRRVCWECEADASAYRWERWRRRSSAEGRAHVSLFSGIGGLDIAAELAGFKTVALCEVSKPCRRVLAANFPDAHLFGDINHVTGRTILDRVGRPTIISAGLPVPTVQHCGKA